LVHVMFPIALGDDKFWSIILYLFLIIVGVTTIVSLVYSAQTVLMDRRKKPTGRARRVYSLLLCFLGAGSGVLYSLDTGIIFSDLIFHYVRTYSLPSIAIF
jgi:SNF family Na+-dependent transporter